MTVSTYTVNLVHALLAPFFGDDDDSPHYGAADIEAAINETAAIIDRKFTATLAEPELKDFGGFFQRDWKVSIPVTASDYEDPGALVFDLPTAQDDDSALLYVLMDAVGADEIADIEGAEVPMEVVGGNPMVFWDAIASPSKGTEDNPIRGEDIEDALPDESSDDESAEDDADV